MNRLQYETSPYLLQHAHNPVDWYPWGEEALGLARQEDKPILLSIGYAACHWCHVMERESFEDPETAALMNRHFVNIKIDREERPDLDHVYMDALQAMTGSGGWPLNIFLTPDLQPFYGGTYFPPRPVHNRPSWPQVLEAIARSFKEKREQIAQQAAQLTQHLQEANSFGLRNDNKEESLFSLAGASDAVTNILKLADTQWGGFSQAPKFPQTFTIQYLMRAAYVLDNQESATEQNDAAMQQALLSIDCMINGGIYDQLGGGLARYSTDREWLAPHFEKMLYDNALLLATLSEAYQITARPRYRQVMEEIIGFVQREMMHPEGGFYSALDADSEGEEGRFYVWSKAEVDEVLGNDAPLFCEFFDVTDSGNWEGSNILRILNGPEELASSNGQSVEMLQAKLDEGRKKLLEARGRRPRPQLDDKVILGWNALCNTGLSKAYAATGETSWLRLAEGNMEFLLRAFKVSGDNSFHHTWKAGQARIPAFLDDYAWLIQALLNLQQVSGKWRYVELATELTRLVLERFSDEEQRYFYFTPAGQSDILVRKKEVYDGATPSGNAVMAANLYRLSILVDQPAWQQRARSMLLALGQAVLRYPTSFGCWNALLLEITAGTAEVAIVGKDWAASLAEMQKIFLPHCLWVATPESDSSIPLLAGKEAGDPVQIYVCRDYACQQPVTSTNAAISLINRVRGNK